MLTWFLARGWWNITICRWRGVQEALRWICNLQHKAAKGGSVILRACRHEDHVSWSWINRGRFQAVTPADDTALFRMGQCLCSGLQWVVFDAGKENCLIWTVLDPPLPNTELTHTNTLSQWVCVCKRERAHRSDSITELSRITDHSENKGGLCLWRPADDYNQISQFKTQSLLLG